MTRILGRTATMLAQWHTHPWGKVHVDDGGVTTFETRADGKHTSLLPRMDYEDIRKTIDDLVKESKHY